MTSEGHLQKPEAVFFDWDGTLSDSYHFLEAAHNHILAELGLPGLAEGEYTQYFGKPRDMLYTKIYGEREVQAQKLFLEYVENNIHKTVKIEGADELLAFLRAENIVIGIVTNKKKEAVHKEILHFGWMDYFTTVVCAGEAEQDKPSGAPLRLAVEKANLSIQRNGIWFVGDTESDLACAQDAGVPCVFIEGHVPPGAWMTLYSPALRVKNCSALQEILVAFSSQSSKKSLG